MKLKYEWVQLIIHSSMRICDHTTCNICHHFNILMIFWKKKMLCPRIDVAISMYRNFYWNITIGKIPAWLHVLDKWAYLITFRLQQLCMTITSQVTFEGILFMEINREIGRCSPKTSNCYVCFLNFDHHRNHDFFFSSFGWCFSLDLYLPTNTDKKKPVVIFVSGGAWIIG